MSTTKDFTKKVVLTQAQFDARQTAGTLQEGVEYCISDYAPSLTELGVTATASELNTLDGITATTTELNYCDGVTSNIQTQLNGKQPSLPSGTTGYFLKKTASGVDWDSVPAPSDMTGATSSAAGTHGLVPAPQAGDQEKFLRGDGTWQTAGGVGPVVTTITLQASTWSNATYPLEGLYPISDFDIFVEPSSTATYEQVMAWCGAFITANSTTNNLIAKGDVPTIDIPIIVKSYPSGSASSAETTMYAANWSNGEYSFENVYPFASYDIYICPSSTATTTQIGAFATAMITAGASSNVAVAKNIVPTIDIPVSIRVVTKNA